jgi:hypothetical protein
MNGRTPPEVFKAGSPSALSDLMDVCGGDKLVHGCGGISRAAGGVKLCHV